MTMIEKVARAMALSHWPNSNKWKVYERAAKVAIAAMREPTEEMSIAGGKQVRACTDRDDFADLQANAIYEKMIDAALKE